MNKVYKDIVFVGLTGQSGAGKTTIGKLFVEHNFGVINCDLVSRKVTCDGSNCLNDLVAEFSDKILSADHKLDRKALGEIVFTDNEKLLRLNEIIFPYITDKIISVAEYLIETGFKIIVFDAPTLFESSIDKICDIIVSVIADEDIRIERIINRDNISKELAVARIASQYDDDFFISQSDIIIKNNVSLHLLKEEFNTTARYITNFKKEV